MGKGEQIFLGLFTVCIFIVLISIMKNDLKDDLKEYKFCIVRDFKTTECQKLVRDVKEQFEIKETVERK